MRVLTVLLLAALTQYGACDDLQPQGSTIQSTKYNVMATFVDALEHELRHFPFPPVIALVALIFGLVLLFDGKKSFNATITFAFAVAFGIVAKAAALSHWQEHNTHADSSPNNVANFVGFEVALLVGAVAHYGHKGVLVILGAAAGLFVAHFVRDFLVINFNCTFMLHVEAEVVWYSVCALFASIAIYKDKHVGILASLSPIPGGIFTASALLYFATEICVAFACNHANVKNMWKSDDAVCPNNLTPKTGQWIDFFLLGFSKTQSLTGKEDVGIFYNSTFNIKHGSFSGQNQHAILYDHLLTVGLWIALSLIGIKVQRCIIRKRHERTLADKKTAVEKRKADESMQEASERKKAEEAAEKRAAAEKKAPQHQQQHQQQTHSVEKKAPQPAATSKWPFSKKEVKVATLEEGLLQKDGVGA